MEGFAEPPIPFATAASFVSACTDGSGAIIDDFASSAECLAAFNAMGESLGCASAKCQKDFDNQLRRNSMCLAGDSAQACQGISAPCTGGSSTSIAVPPTATETADPEPGMAAVPAVPAPRTLPPTPDGDDDGGSSVTGPVIGGVAGGLVLIALLAASIAFFVWRRRRQPAAPPQDKSSSTAHGAGAAARPPPPPPPRPSPGYAPQHGGHGGPVRSRFAQNPDGPNMLQTTTHLRHALCCSLTINVSGPWSLANAS